MICAVLLALCLCTGSAAAQTQAAADAAEAVAQPAEILVMFHLPAPHLRADSYGSADYRDDGGRAARQRLAAAVAQDYHLQLLEDWAMPALNLDCYRMRLPTGQAPAPVLAALAQDKRVQWAQLIQHFVAQGGSDPLFRTQPSTGLWQMDEVRKAATGRKVNVAVVDSGVESHHPDLAGQVVVEQNFVDGQPYVAELHGTAVAGVIAARAGNGIGIEGVAPEARLLALRACWQDGGATRCNSFTLAKAINYALSNHVQVLNLSLSGPSDRLLQQLLEVALARGMRVVGAVDPARADGGFPASVPGVFAVAADGSAARGGSQVLLAPGRDIPTTMPGGRWGLVNGSSYAAAHVSGMLALLEELRPQLPAARLRDGIVQNGGSAALTGIDLCATILRISGKCPCACPPGSASHYVRSR